ncbi:hypothetical protein RIF29_23040 [Crotalaria pallida]|uniref:Uncharacterized protein n=1 Tax=Crotalaria pallida TaxID=3830 RepID=A0AAN9FE38_CROPI
MSDIMILFSPEAQAEIFHRLWTSAPFIQSYTSLTHLPFFSLFLTYLTHHHQPTQLLHSLLLLLLLLLLL